MREERKATIELFECPECKGDLVEDSTTSTTYCTRCQQVFKSTDVQAVQVDTVYVMEDSDMIKDDSGIGYELRELVDNM